VTRVITAVDLFCGAGGFTEALRQLCEARAAGKMLEWRIAGGGD